LIKVAFCDDELSVLTELCGLLDRYGAARGQDFQGTAFRSPFELLAKIERGIHFDIVFLDILMPGESGMTAAAEIRSYDSDVKIIFLTSSSEFAVESYTVGAHFYQLKPMGEEAFFRLMDSAVSACENVGRSSLLLRFKNGIARVELRHIEYCEVMHRTLFLHLTDGRVLEYVGSLDELSKHLTPAKGFLRPHRSYLVNLEHVRSLSYKAFVMTCLTEIPIPRGKYQSIKDAYLAFAFQNGQVMV